MSFQIPDSTTSKSVLLINEESVAPARRSPIGGWTKRSLDLVIALIALIAFSPLLLMVAALVKLWDRGPVFYRQPRIGFDSRLFPCFKFRTMAVNSDDALARHLRESPEAAREWAVTRKLKSDPRVTTVGHVLRQLSLDELPQLWNVVKGDMSLVGPRPVVPDELKMYGPHATFYLRARPGLTGVWQVSGRNDVSYEKRVSLDRAYVAKWSFWRDIVIIAKTIPVVISSRGTY